jgi:Predicted metal-dependent hydrolase of the TIM-barrel fold
MKEIIQEYPQLRIAIGHFGMVTTPHWQEQIKLARHKNVMIESGGITWLFNSEFYPFHGAVKAIKEAADLVGMDKLMWGSDYLGPLRPLLTRCLTISSLKRLK